MSENGLSCRLCSGTDLRTLIDLGALPVAHRLLSSDDDDEEIFPLSLHNCNDCGLIQIVEPIDPETLYSNYNYNFSSWKSELHLESELDVIVAGGVPESALEIGCNDGRFLAQLRERGVTTVVGVEPNPISGSIAREREFPVFSDMISSVVCDAATQEFGRFDLVVSRQVLEHLVDLDNFFSCVKLLLTDDGHLFIDVPDFETSLSSGDCSMIWEEHVSYFTEPVLMGALRKHGFKPKSIHRYDFSGGTIAVLASRSDATQHESTVLVGHRAAVANYESKVEAYRNRLTTALEAGHDSGLNVVLYGTGCRACTTVNGLGLGPHIDFAIDDQKDRQGKYMPGCRLLIRRPEVLKRSRTPFICLLAVNNENEEKVMERLRRTVGDRMKFVSLLGPKDIWTELAAVEAACGTGRRPSVKH